MLQNIIVSGAVGIASSAASVLSNATNVPLGGAIAVGVFACTLTYWLSGRLQKIDSAIENIQKRLDSLPCEGRECEKKP